MEDDYYYDDDGYDAYYDTGAEEVADVDPLEVQYIDGKSYMQNNVEESLRCLKAVLDKDTQRGRWSFKALKMLARACRVAKQYEAMADYYDQVVHFTHPDIEPAAIAKAMLKFSEESARVPETWRERTLQLTLEAASADVANYRGVLVPTLLRRATLFLEEHKSREALEDLQMALQVCEQPSSNLAQLQATAVYQIRALQLVAYRKLRRFAELRHAYYALTAVQTALPPLRMVGGVMESAGHLFLHDGDWAAAHRAFAAALRCYTESGDAQQYAVVKYVVLATMMTGLPVDIFSQDESLADHPSVRPVRALWKAFVACDIPAFLAVLQDCENVACFVTDNEFAPYVDDALYQLRLNYLLHYAQSFAAVSLVDLARRLRMEEQPCVALCTSTLLHGRLRGHIDDAAKVLRLDGGAETRQDGSSDLHTLCRFAEITNELCGQRLRY